MRSVRSLPPFTALLGLLAVLSVGDSSARAQSYGQYLVVLDDSGSMERSDPQRLVVMAAAALTASLDDADQVMLVGLNELASGAVNGPQFRSPSQILQDRDGDPGERALTDATFARLAAFEGQTPCDRALDRARAILNDVASAGAPQTLLLLTDGACNGGLQPAARWLGGLRSYQDDRFRFALLVRRGGGRPDRRLVEYAEQTGWRANAEVAFDARALLRAFAEVLSFSRGLTFDEGGRVGLERTFAGARSVRALAVHEGGTTPLQLQRTDGTELRGGPTYRSLFGWSLRSVTFEPTPTPIAVRSSTDGAEVLVIPVYGKLRVEAVIGPCGEAPTLPWEHELAVRAGHPACAWARLVGDSGETIVPGRSFDFSMAACETGECPSPATMQPGGGIFHAQLGQLPEGRHERVIRASGGALAFPVDTARGARSVAFGIHRITRAEAPETPVHRLDLGRRPVAHPERTALVVHGAFPAGARARVRCEVHGGEVARCLRCLPPDEPIELQDQLRIEVDLRATPYCQALQVGHQSGEATVDADLIIEPVDEGPLLPHHLPVRAELSYPVAEPLELTLLGGGWTEEQQTVPAPPSAMRVALTPVMDADRLELEADSGELTPRAGDRSAAVRVRASANECCDAGTYDGVLRLEADGSVLEVPLRVMVQDPGWWTCPGQKILRWTLAVLGVLLLIWIVRGFLSPNRFREGAVLLYAESHGALLDIREGDDGHRPFRRFPGTRRGFRRDAALHLGGPRAPLPSLQRMADDARLVATGGGGALLIVDREEAVERFTEAEGWEPVPIGAHPVASRMTLRRGDGLYLEVRP